MQMLSDIALQKKQLRETLIKKRSVYPQVLRLEHDKKIINNIISSNILNNIDIVLSYVSFGFEVDTFELIKKLIYCDRNIAVPVCNTENNTLKFYLIDSIDDLHLGHYGILEPDINRCKPIENNNNTICFVPALSYDTLGNRIGYGKGYYDSFLKKYEGIKIGLCYNEFLVRELPHEDFDIPVDMIITENGSFYVKK